MEQHHSHNHHHEVTSLNTIFILCIVINLAFVIIEAGVGFIYNSLGLLSDAGHNLSDVFSLLLSGCHSITVISISLMAIKKVPSLFRLSMQSSC